MCIFTYFIYIFIRMQILEGHRNHFANSENMASFNPAANRGQDLISFCPRTGYDWVNFYWGKDMRNLSLCQLSLHRLHSWLLNFVLFPFVPSFMFWLLSNVCARYIQRSKCWEVQTRNSSNHSASSSGETWEPNRLCSALCAFFMSLQFFNMSSTCRVLITQEPWYIPIKLFCLINRTYHYFF